ncbi:glycoside hydrolase family 2 TIM barrel-domain containing protein [uncultured Roseibium sp.]|uniref:glycoside hydrolase family 2 protein n=1 Tax=uncultured Roseibium sp. TaxID=1936171 RepID=UPI00262C1FDF|nr:glycoside hydrolase family 2 TIM barrel-domain containing protein [uncultured Roseibium sp.]
MPKKLNFCEDWTFAAGFEPQMAGQHLVGETVRLPHTAVELPFDYFDERSYQKPFTYQKKLQWSDAFRDREINLVFDGVMANASVFLNGVHVAGHKDGYTPFEVRLTEAFRDGECLITVCVDGSENPDIPPFGGRIDYLTYAGIYREAWLQIADSISIKTVKIETQDTLSEAPGVFARIWLSNPAQTAINGQLHGELVSPDGEIIAASTTDIVADQIAALAFENLKNISLWDLDKPALYTLRLAMRADGSKDTFETVFGFRTAEFTPAGFLLNGRKVKLIGLNRHQSFPYSGYAQGRASQERDAELLKEELGCNIVRTSHYPQSPWFLDHCDRIGLLVLEEIPGWQHIGGETWKDEAVQNVRRMIERDWNHPSIVLWGVRINESADDDAFYQRTNALARELDRTRQTGGIRKDTESSLLEDVYTFNDFVLGSFEDPRVNRPRTPLRDRKETTGLVKPVPYLVTEYNGHMYPTKIFDQEQRQIEHVTRHLEILNAAYGDDAVSGCIGWCMFDYNTHQDFGSGDRVCYHGVMTMFREMKLAGYAYASQTSPNRKVILEPVSIWARGERNIGGTLPLMVLSNCDEIRMTYSNGNSFEIFRDTVNFPHLPHPPFCLELSTEAEDALGVWGHDWPDVEFTGYVNGEPVVTRNFVANPLATELRLEPDRLTLNPDHNETRVLAKALDQVGNPLTFLNDSVSIELDGPIELIGPEKVALRGGGTGFWVRAQSGKKGNAHISVKTSRFPEKRLTLQVE